MKTRIYIDGFNFYYGRLKRTPYKWIDVVTLFAHQAVLRDTSYTSPHVKYFTANISEKAASSPSSLKDQSNYISALKALYDEDKLSIKLGTFQVSETEAFHISDPQNVKPPSECQKVAVWKMEEKKSDVSMAVEAITDALMEDDLEQVIFVTNDSDQVPTLSKIRQLKPNIKIGLIYPIRKSSGRPPSTELSKLADWSIQDLRNSWLKRSQLPRVIHKNHNGHPLKVPRVKPDGWFGEPEIVSEIIEILKTTSFCRGKIGKCWKLLEMPVPERDGVKPFEKEPIHMLDTKEEAEQVLEFVKKFAAAHPLRK